MPRKPASSVNNMVSAKKQGASKKSVSLPNAKTSVIRKRPGRKPAKQVGLLEKNDNLKSMTTSNENGSDSNKSDGDREREMEKLRHEIKLLTEENQSIKAQQEQLHKPSEFNTSTNNRSITPSNLGPVEQPEVLDLTLPRDYSLARARTPVRFAEPPVSLDITSNKGPYGHRVKVEKFKGSADEDYDVWWEDLQAFFALNSYSEKDKIRLFNAYLGGEARKFLQNEDMEKFDKVEQLHELLRGTFSDKYDWQNVLMNIAQKPDEKIRPFSVRLRVAARKCGFQGPMLDNTCVNYLKRSCLPYLKHLLGYCLPGTPYDVVVEHAIQYERAKDLESPEKGEKKSLKRKTDDLDAVEDADRDESPTKKKQFSSQTIQSIKDMVKDQINSLGEKMESHFSPNRTNRVFQNKPKMQACLHCAKPNHRYTECNSASAADKNNISRLLREKNFDFAKHHERAELFLKNRQDRFAGRFSTEKTPLNSTTPPQQGK